MTSVQIDLSHIPSVQIISELLPAYVTNTGQTPRCVADACGQPAERTLVLTFPRHGSYNYQLPVCMQHVTPTGRWFCQPGNSPEG